MDLITINFYDYIKDDPKKQDQFLSDLIIEAIQILNAYWTDNSKATETKRQRLILMEDYIKKTYNVSTPIYSILKIAFKNLTYNREKTKIIIRDDIRCDNSVSLVQLLQTIRYGTLNYKGSDVIQYILNAACGKVFIMSFAYKWGIM